MVPILPPKLKCFHCWGKYPENMMADHLAECEQQRPYGCPTCHRRFQSAIGVNHHAAVTHTAEERQSRFSCKYPDCGFGTDDRQSLQQHHARHVVGFRRSCSRERSRSRQASVARSEASNVQGEQEIRRRGRSRERRQRPHIQAALNVQQQQQEIQGTSRDFFAGRPVLREESISLDEMPPSIQRQLVQEIQGRSRDSYTDPLMREIMGMPPLVQQHGVQQIPRRGRSRQRHPLVPADHDYAQENSDNNYFNAGPVVREQMGMPPVVQPHQVQEIPRRGRSRQRHQQVPAVHEQIQKNNFAGPVVHERVGIGSTERIETPPMVQQEIPRRGRSRQRRPQVQTVREPESNFNDAPVSVPRGRFPIQGVERMETPPPLSDEHQEPIDEELFRQNEYAPSSRRNAQLQPVPEYIQFVEQLNKERASSPRNVRPHDQSQPAEPEQNEQASSSQNVPNRPAGFVQEFMEQLQQQQSTSSSSQNAPNQPPIFDPNTGLYSLQLINPTVARQIMVDQNARVDAMIFEIQRDYQELKRMETEFGAPPNGVVNAAVEHVITEFIDKFAGRSAVEEEEDDDEEEEESGNDENEDEEEMEEGNEESENGEEEMEDDDEIVIL